MMVTGSYRHLPMTMDQDAYHHLGLPAIAENDDQSEQITKVSQENELRSGNIPELPCT